MEPEAPEPKRRKRPRTVSNRPAPQEPEFGLGSKVAAGAVLLAIALYFGHCVGAYDAQNVAENVYWELFMEDAAPPPAPPQQSQAVRDSAELARNYLPSTEDEREEIRAYRLEGTLLCYGDPPYRKERRVALYDIRSAADIDTLAKFERHLLAAGKRMPRREVLLPMYAVAVLDLKTRPECRSTGPAPWLAQ